MMMMFLCRFDMDFDDDVLYVYEIQLEKELRRKGLGKKMVTIIQWGQPICDVRGKICSKTTD